MRNNEPLRYERKFLITGRSFEDVRQIIRFHPAMFSAIYHERRINNIYFDTKGFDSYYQNLEGEQFRKKARLRWYGDLFGTAKSPILEFKIKKGLLGNKDSYTMPDLIVDKGFSASAFSEYWNDLPPAVRDQMKALNPVILNSYVRRYFLSADKKFRLTIDRDLSWYRVSGGQNLFLHKVEDPHAVVVELKYDHTEETEAAKIFQGFPFPMTKNSKYQQGIESIYGF